MTAPFLTSARQEYFLVLRATTSSKGSMIEVLSPKVSLHYLTAAETLPTRAEQNALAPRHKPTPRHTPIPMPTKSLHMPLLTPRFPLGVVSRFLGESVHDTDGGEECSRPAALSNVTSEFPRPFGSRFVSFSFTFSERISPAPLLASVESGYRPFPRLMDFLLAL